MLLYLFAALIMGSVGFVLSRRLARARVRVTVPEVNPDKILADAKKQADDRRKHSEAEAKLY